MSAVKSYQKLGVWQKAILWIENIYRATKSFPAEERFGLTSQVQRAAVPVAANIAEEAARTGNKEFLQFLSIASGSLAETETLLILSGRLQLLLLTTNH